MNANINDTMPISAKRLLPRIALIACGSFSPPTPMHFRMFEIARDHFEMHKTHQVVGGIVSPTHDSYQKKGLTLGKHRCAMLKLALQSSSWIRASDWEVSQPQWSRTVSVLQYHQNFINNYINSPKMDGDVPGWLPAGLRDCTDGVQVKLLCGADLLESFAVPGLWSDDDIEDIIGNHGLVVISRSGTNPEKFIFESDILTKYQRNITLVTNWVPNEVSSTMIRRLISRGQSVKYLLDDNVIEYIKLHGIFNYQTKYITELTRPTQFNYKVEILNRVKITNRLPSNENTPSDEEADDGDVDEEHMDETDYSIKNILTSINLDNRRANMFCCGEGDNVVTKLLTNRRSGPGQAVQVITMEKGIAVTHTADSEENTNAKKLKISAAQDV